MSTQQITGRQIENESITLDHLAPELRKLIEDLQARVQVLEEQARS